MALDPIAGRLEGLAARGDTKAPQHTEPTTGVEFKQFLLDKLNKVNTMQQDAGKAVTDLVMGNQQDITQVMTAVEKADVAFQTLMSVRNKLVESYQEILRMRI